VNGGFLGSLAIQAGTSVGRILYALLALFGAGVLLQGATFQLALGVFGITVLFYLGITAIRDGRTAVVSANTSSAYKSMLYLVCGQKLASKLPRTIAIPNSEHGRLAQTISEVID
jgi:threonine/homoserine/homoserine lactone efflux protein